MNCHFNNREINPLHCNNCVIKKDCKNWNEPIGMDKRASTFQIG